MFKNIVDKHQIILKIMDMKCLKIVDMKCIKIMDYEMFKKDSGHENV